MEIAFSSNQTASGRDSLRRFGFNQAQGNLIKETGKQFPYFE